MFLSLRWRAFAWAVLIAIVASHGTTAQRECAHAGIEAAIVTAVQARMGGEAQVTLGECYLRGLGARGGAAVLSNLSPSGALSPDVSGEKGKEGVALAGRDELVAVPDAGARTGGFARFVIFEAAAVRASVTARTGASLGPRVGSVDVELHVAVPHARARRGLAPRSVLLREDLEATIGDVGRMPLATLPRPEAIVGARVVRPIPMGRPIVESMIAAAPLVKSGDEVRTIVRVGGLEARGTAIAAQTGTLGEEIRVVNADSRRSLKARVVGARQVEVIHD